MRNRIAGAFQLRARGLLGAFRKKQSLAVRERLTQNTDAMCATRLHSTSAGCDATKSDSKIELPSADPIPVKATQGYTPETRSHHTVRSQQQPLEIVQYLGQSGERYVVRAVITTIPQGRSNFFQTPLFKKEDSAQYRAFVSNQALWILEEIVAGLNANQAVRKAIFIMRQNEISPKLGAESLFHNETGMHLEELCLLLGRFESAAEVEDGLGNVMSSFYR